MSRRNSTQTTANIKMAETEIVSNLQGLKTAWNNVFDCRKELNSNNSYIQNLKKYRQGCVNNINTIYGDIDISRKLTQSIENIKFVIRDDDTKKLLRLRSISKARRELYWIMRVCNGKTSTKNAVYVLRIMGVKGKISNWAFQFDNELLKLKRQCSASEEKNFKGKISLV